MPRRKAHAPLRVLMNGRAAGLLDKEPDGAIRFVYDEAWLAWEHAFAISLSLPLRDTPWTGERVRAVFENLLPDNPEIRRRVAERTGAAGTDAYSLLEEIGRDCVGAMQFLRVDEDHPSRGALEGEALSNEEIERTLANLGRAPLGMEGDEEFRISVAGAQEKTALLLQDGRWLRPIGTTPTTHILKPELGEIPTAFGTIDLRSSVDNEHYCMVLLEEFGLETARTWIETFGSRRVLVVERFDRLQRGPEILRLPQEDCCQALGIPPARKYQNQGGPSAVDILRLLRGADQPQEDQADLLRTLIVFWLIGATDGHGKNFSIFLRPGGRLAMTPLYDVLTAQPAFDARQIPNNRYKLAMSAGNSRKYRILEISGRHFVETAREAGMGPSITLHVMQEIIERAEAACERARARMPADFHEPVHASVANAIGTRLGLLESGLGDVRAF